MFTGGCLHFHGWVPTCSGVGAYMFMGGCLYVHGWVPICSWVGVTPDS